MELLICFKPNEKISRDKLLKEIRLRVMGMKGNPNIKKEKMDLEKNIYAMYVELSDREYER